MSNVLFVSDLHLGHRTILEHTAKVSGGAYRGGSTVAEHDQWVIERCLSAAPTKRTVWWFLGDVAMEEEALLLLDALPGRKMLILGNHDLFPTAAYLRHFEWLGGTIKRYDVWLSHTPLHPLELRGHPNVHGHCHHHNLRDDLRYLNCAIEWLPDNQPITLEQMRELLSREEVIP